MINSTEGLLRLKEVLEIVPVSRSTWYAGVQSGIYPSSISIGSRAVAWKASEIYAIVEGGVNV